MLPLNSSSSKAVMLMLSSRLRLNFSVTHHIGKLKLKIYFEIPMKSLETSQIGNYYFIKDDVLYSARLIFLLIRRGKY